MKLSHVVGAGLFLSAIAGSAFAQRPGGGQPGQPGQRGQRGQRGARQVSTAQIPVDVLDTLVKLTPDQKTKIGAIDTKLQADMKAARPAPGSQPDPAVFQKMQEINKTANDAIEAILTADQKTKLTESKKELTAIQSAGIPIALYGKIKLTDDQKSKLKAISKETAEKMAALPQEERRTKGREIRTEAQTKAKAILTPDQTTAIEKYEKEHPRPQRGGGAGGAGRPGRP